MHNIKYKGKRKGKIRKWEREYWEIKLRWEERSKSKRREEGGGGGWRENNGFTPSKQTFPFHLPPHAQSLPPLFFSFFQFVFFSLFSFFLYLILFYSSSIPINNNLLYFSSSIFTSQHITKASATFLCEFIYNCIYLYLSLLHSFFPY